MKKEKVFLAAVSLAVLGLVVTAKAWANEGVIRLAGKTEAAGRCYAASVYLDGNYRILMTCRDLKMAADPVRNRYVVWVQSGTANLRVGEIVSGKMESSTDQPFEKVFITLEKDAYALEPNAEVALAGQVEAIDFGRGMVDPGIIKISGTPTPSTSVTATTTPYLSPNTGGPTAKPTPAPAGNRLVAVVAGIGKAILIGFILLLVVVGVMGFLARRKSL